MEKYLNTGVKQIIDQFPKVAEILDSYGIGCAPCNVGTCLLKDVVEIHNMPVEKERELLTKIAKVIYPGQNIEIPEIKRRQAYVEGEFKFSPPMQDLVDEHKIIKRWLALIPKIVKKLDLSLEADREIIKTGIELIKNYADKLHHAKEEEILFDYFDRNVEIVKSMYADHDKARGYVKNATEGLESRDLQKVSENLLAYKALLEEHIKKEDEILYPWMDRGLSTYQVGEMFSRFADADQKYFGVEEKYSKFVCELEKKEGSL